jgi:coatomer subunit beta
VIEGEDALANLSVEKTEAGEITGHVRIRSKTQGIALSLGDKITMGEYFPSAYDLSTIRKR